MLVAERQASPGRWGNHASSSLAGCAGRLLADATIAGGRRGDLQQRLRRQTRGSGTTNIYEDSAAQATGRGANNDHAWCAARVEIRVSAAVGVGNPLDDL